MNPASVGGSLPESDFLLRQQVIPNHLRGGGHFAAVLV